MSTPPVASQFHYKVKNRPAHPDYAAPTRDDNLNDKDYSARPPRLSQLLPDDDDLFDDDYDDQDYSHDNNSHPSQPVQQFATYTPHDEVVQIARPFTATGVRGERERTVPSVQQSKHRNVPSSPRRQQQEQHQLGQADWINHDTIVIKPASSTSRRLEPGLAPPRQKSSKPSKSLFTRFAPPSPEPRQEQHDDPDSPVPRLIRARTDTFGDREPHSPETKGFRNLNRWSTSSTGTAYRPVTRDTDEGFPPSLAAQVATTAGRRGSVDSFTKAIPPPAYVTTAASPRRLTKPRPPTADPSSPSVKSRFARSTSRPRRQSPPPAAGNAPSLPPNLPHIITLPPLDTSQGGLVKSPGGYKVSSPSIATPNSVFAPQNGERSDYFWDAISGRTNQVPVSNPSAAVSRPVAAAEHNDNDNNNDDNDDDMPGHTRSRSSNAKGSGDSTKTRDRSKPSQKAMLSKALGKANTAVQLDNAQNYEGAREAYVEACDLLQLVLARTTGEEDRKKLEAIVSINSDSAV